MKSTGIKLRELSPIGPVRYAYRLPKPMLLPPHTGDGLHR